MIPGGTNVFTAAVPGFVVACSSRIRWWESEMKDREAKFMRISLKEMTAECNFRRAATGFRPGLAGKV